MLLAATSALVSSAWALDLHVAMTSPAGERTAVTYHDVESGPLPALRLPVANGRRWTAEFAYDGGPGVAALKLRLVEQTMVGPFPGAVHRQLGGRIALSTVAASTRLPVDPQATLPSPISVPSGPAWVVEAKMVGAVSNGDGGVEATKLVEMGTQAASAGDVVTARDVLGRALAQFPGSRQAAAAERVLKELAAVGLAAPAIAPEKWIQGSLAYADAPATLLVYFEVWCPHCKREIPELAARAESLRAMGVQVLLVTRLSKTSTEEGTLSFLAEYGVPFATLVDDNSRMTDAAAVSGIPAAAIARDGVIIWRGHPARLDDATLRGLLGAP
ncbi:MAG: TlpA family protein disulfide reductase [Deltaproteobacteria bacterium]|nr:TlpA family protein disulfide reductase [Deltaproteobacteria bacterium]